MFGEYDIIAKVEAEDLGKYIVNKIRAIDGVADTETLPFSKLFEDNDKPSNSENKVKKIKKKLMKKI